MAFIFERTSYELIRRFGTFFYHFVVVVVNDVMLGKVVFGVVLVGGVALLLCLLW